MKQSIATAAMAALLGTASMASVQAEGITGYVYDRNGNIVQSMLGCTRSKNWLKEPVIGCDGYEGEIPEPQPVVLPILDEKQKVLETRHYPFGQLITFEFDSATLTPEAKLTLKRNREQVRDKIGRAKAVRVVGRTDHTGSDEYNEALSMKRAEAVRDYLIELGAEPAIFTLETRGEALPLFPNMTKDGRRRNRTAEVFVVVEE